MVFLIMFKKLVPETTRKEFIKKLFQTKINWGLFLSITVIQFLLVFISIFVVSVRREVSMLNIIDVPFSMLFSAFFMNLVTGATGEELAWRGYLFPQMAKESGVIKGSILLGLNWGFWHTPLWFATSGFMGFDLVLYIITFMVMIVSVSVIIGICYNHNNNFVIPIWIHLLVNFSASFYGGNMVYTLEVTMYLALLYLLTALGFSLWQRKMHEVSKGVPF